MIHILTYGAVKLLKMITICKIIALTICLGLSAFIEAYAYEQYPDHMNDDLNYPLLSGHMGYGTFMDIASVSPLGEDDGYNWSVDSVTTADGSRLERRTTYYYYGYDGSCAWSSDGFTWNYFDLSSDAGYMVSTINAFKWSLYYAYGIQL